MPAIDCAFTAEAVRLRWHGESTEFPSIWLRDNCRSDRDQESGQRLIDIADLPMAPRIRQASLADGWLHVAWEGESEAARFELGWLRAHAPGSGHGRPELSARPWLDGATLNATRDFSWISLPALEGDRARRLDWLMHLLADGIAFVSDVPSRDQAILAAVSPVGLVLDTNYGRVFDVRSVPQPENLAYSDRGLGLHTDNPYRDPVPGFQALHCLISSAEGGESIFADGFALAGELKRTHPEAYATLIRTPVPFHYRSKDAELYSEKPLIEVAAGGELRAIHYNNRSVAPLRLPARELAAFYAAYRALATLLRDSRFHLHTKLRDGDLVVFDNRRILHGRTGFTSALRPRHLQGCYLARDSVLNATALLRRQLQGESAR